MNNEHEKIHALEEDILKLQKELRTLRNAQTSEVSGNFLFSNASGDISLLDLFGDQDDLIIVHNMGHTCAYCTTYADGINGVAHHIQNRCPLVFISPDPVEKQQAFAASRGWTFDMISTAVHGEAFNIEMGFYKEGSWPGFSAFRRNGETITRTGFSSFDPGDEFCVVWPMIQLLQDGTGGWAPQFDYANK